MFMQDIYVPILKWKKGEQDALKELPDKIKDSIIPLIEMTADCKIENLSKTFDKSWNGRLYYFDVKPECYSELGGSIYWDFLKQCPQDYAIPVLNLSDSESIFSEVIEESNNGIAIRIFGDEFELVEEELNSLVENGILLPPETDIIIDLKYLDEDDLYSKKSVLKNAINDINNIGNYRRIIVSSNSFKNKTQNIKVGEIYYYQRNEMEVFKTAIKLSNKHKFDLVYSDYGPFDLETQEFILGMTPSFKIRYTNEKDYMFIKGLSTKKGGLDSENIAKLCELIIESGHFYGQDYSWGDSYISRACLKPETCGNLTTWVQVAMNHHITVVVNQLSNLP